MTHANLSRRAILAGAVAVPVLALPAVAVAAPALAPVVSAGNADAELLALGTKLESLIVDWRAQHAVEMRRGRSDEAARRRAGMPRIKFGSVPDEEYRAYQEKRFKIRGKYAAEEDAETNERGQNVAWNALTGRKCQLVNAIYSHKARTAAGLAVQTRAYSLDWIELWEKGYESQEGARQFADLVCAFVGVAPVAMEGKIAKALQAMAVQS
jgi:hypothetical protein